MFSSLRTTTRRAALRVLLGAPVALGAIGRLNPLRASAATTDPSSLGTMTLVVAGLDTREPDQPENTDVLMVARVDLVKKTVRAVSIPRDLWVTIPDYGKDKINRAYDYGSSQNGGRDFKSGAQRTAATIYENFGVDLDASVMTNFRGFGQIVDAFGGITVNNPYDVYDADYPTPEYGTAEVHFPKGELHLDGTQALAFCRTRHQDGDDGRVMRQHLVIRQLLAAARKKDGVSLQKLVEANRDAFYTDLGKTKQLALALAAPDFTNAHVSFAVLSPYISPSTADNGAWIYAGDWSKLPGFVQGFLKGSIKANA